MREQLGDNDSEPLSREETWQRALGKQKGWTAPDPDGTPGYWLKVFRGAAAFLKAEMWEMLNGRREIPEWFVRGRKVMLPKEGCTGRPEQFRPITCLNTAYKLLTG